MKRMLCSPRIAAEAARALMAELEAWARTRSGMRLQCLKREFSAEQSALYEAAGYDRTPNYPPYEGVKESVCASGKGYNLF